jgi:hypothetical protein
MPPPNSQKVETTLADLAVNLVFERTPALADHYLGFELIPGSQNEENTRAAGLLGFRVGNEDIYIPVLFLSGKIKGTEVIYLKNADVFTSNSKQWVDYLTTSDTGVMGGGATPTAPLQQPSSRGLAVFSRAPGTMGKLGAFFDGAANDFWRKVATSDADWSELGHSSLNLKDVLKGLGKQAYLGFLETLDANPKFLEKVAAMFDLDNEVLISDWPEEKAASDGDAALSGNAKIAARIKESNEPVFLSSKQAEALHREGHISLSSDELEQCFSNGYFIFDKRAEDETTLVLKEDYRHRFESPKESGFYEIINSAGDLQKVLIAHHPFVIEKPTKRMSGCLAMDPESGVYVLPVVGEQIFVRSRFSTEESIWKEKFDKMPSISSMEVGKHYMLISPSMDVSAPFKVNGKTKGENGDFSFNCVTPWEISYRCVPSDTYNCSPVPAGCGDGASMSLRVVDREDESRVVSIGNIIYAPSSWRVIEVFGDSNGLSYDWVVFSTDSEQQKKEKAERDAKRKVYFRILPGNSQTVSSILANKNIHELSVEKTAMDYTISLDREVICRGLKMAALETLIAGVGLSQKSASEIIESSVDQKGTKQWVTLAPHSKSAGIIEMIKEHQQRKELESYGQEAGSAIGGALGGAAGAAAPIVGGALIGRGLGSLAGETTGDPEASQRRARIGKLIGTLGGGLAGALAAPTLSRMGSSVGTEAGRELGRTAGGLVAKAARSESPSDAFERILLHGKSAAGPSLNADGLIYGGMSFPEETQQIGVNESGVAETAPQVLREQIPLNSLEDPSQDWRNMDEANWDKIKQRDIDFLMRVADSGSKSVFETSVINLLLRSNRTSSRVAEWLPDLVSGLDSKARLLLSFYWHSSEFSEDYGKDEMAEFEDVLLDSIKSDGQLILFLKQRAGESSSSNIDAFAG